MRRYGAVVMSVFACVWAEIALSFAHTLPIWARAIPLVPTAVILWAALARGDAPAPPAHDDAASARRGRVIMWASAAEGIAILVAINVLNNTGRHDAVVPAVAILVGLHFVPLAWGLRRPLYYATAAALVVAGGAALSIADPSTRGFVAGLGAALVLWITSAFGVGETRRVELARVDA